MNIWVLVGEVRYFVISLCRDNSISIDSCDLGISSIIIIIKLIISELSVSQLYTTRDRAYNLICLESKNRFQFS